MAEFETCLSIAASILHFAAMLVESATLYTGVWSVGFAPMPSNNLIQNVFTRTPRFVHYQDSFHESISFVGLTLETCTSPPHPSDYL
jgi:hypothetical protein